MAITKQTTFTLVCEGPCKQKVEGVTEIPSTWARVKIWKADQHLGRPAEYKVTTVCGNCARTAFQVLSLAGFVFASKGEKS